MGNGGRDAGGSGGDGGTLEPGADAGPLPDGGTTNPEGCGSVGLACGASCPAGYECMGTGEDYCVRYQDDCGGFAGKECPTPDVCISRTGSSAGVCVTPEDHACLCARRPNDVHGC